MGSNCRPPCFHTDVVHQHCPGPTSCCQHEWVRYHGQPARLISGAHGQSDVSGRFAIGCRRLVSFGWLCGSRYVRSGHC